MRWKSSQTKEDVIDSSHSWKKKELSSQSITQTITKRGSIHWQYNTNNKKKDLMELLFCLLDRKPVIFLPYFISQPQPKKKENLTFHWYKRQLLIMNNFQQIIFIINLYPNKICSQTTTCNIWKQFMNAVIIILNTKLIYHSSALES